MTQAMQRARFTSLASFIKKPAFIFFSTASYIVGLVYHISLFLQ